MEGWGHRWEGVSMKYEPREGTIRWGEERSHFLLPGVRPFQQFYLIFLKTEPFEDSVLSK